MTNQNNQRGRRGDYGRIRRYARARCGSTLVPIEDFELTRSRDDGKLKTWGDKLGHRDVVKLLNETLAEEKKTDELLTKLATTAVNAEAA